MEKKKKIKAQWVGRYSLPGWEAGNALNHLKAVKPEYTIADLSFKKRQCRGGAWRGEVCSTEVNFRLISQSLN